MIYSAVYYGDHRYQAYGDMIEELKDRLNIARYLKEEVVINTDLLFEDEVEPYFNDILCPLVAQMTIELLIEDKTLVRIRKIRRIMKKYIITWESAYMHKGRYRMKVWNE